MSIQPAEIPAPIPAFVGNTFAKTFRLQGADFRSSVFSATLTDPIGVERSLTASPGIINEIEANIQVSATAIETEVWREGSHFLAVNVGLETYARGIIYVYGLKNKKQPTDSTVINLQILVNDQVIVLTISGGVADLSGVTKQKSLPFSYGDVTTQTVFRAIAGQRITRIEMGFDTPFNVASSLKVGDGANIQRLMDTGQNNPLLGGIYGTTPFYKYTENTDILLTINAGIGCSQGSGTVIVYYE